MPSMADPTNASLDDNWNGGYYELCIKLGPYDDARLDAALKSLWRASCTRTTVPAPRD